MITKDMTIEQVLHTHPATLPVFKRFGLDCNECQVAAYGTVEHGAGVHGVDLETLLAELNRAAG